MTRTRVVGLQQPGPIRSLLHYFGPIIKRAQAQLNGLKQARPRRVCCLNVTLRTDAPISYGSSSSSPGFCKTGSEVKHSRREKGIETQFESCFFW